MNIRSSLSFLASLLLLLSEPSPISAQTRNPKRGLVYVPHKDYPQDNYIWTRPPTTLSWYYNYAPTPSIAFNNLTQDVFEFVPMMWGLPDNPSTNTTFLTTVRDLISTKGMNISHVLAFNEPDAPFSWGGSNISPDLAAQAWVQNIIPLQEIGIRVGLPAQTGGWGGIPWLRQFLGNCSTIISSGGETKNCTFDFVPIHWYGNFGGLASHIGTYAAAFPGKKIWVTEYNLDNQPLKDTQEFVNMSLDYMDRIPDVERYSLFASFRSKDSNVGINATMLSNGGQLTDIGAMYLGKSLTGVLPQSGGTSGAATTWSGSISVLRALGAAALVGSLTLML